MYRRWIFSMTITDISFPFILWNIYLIQILCSWWTLVTFLKGLSSLQVNFENSVLVNIRRTSLIPLFLHEHFLDIYGLLMEKEMATHSSVLAWRIPGTGDPGGLPSMGSHRVGHDWSDLAAACLSDNSPNYLRKI